MLLDQTIAESAMRRVATAKDLPWLFQRPKCPKLYEALGIGF